MVEWFRALPVNGLPELVVNDGGPDVRSAVADAHPEAQSQRGKWPLVYSLGHGLWNDGVDCRRRSRLQGELHDRISGPDEGRARRAEIRTWAADRLRPHECGPSPVASASGEACYERLSSLQTTSHTEREMRTLNRRTDLRARWTVRSGRNLRRLQQFARRCNPEGYVQLWKAHDHSLTAETRSAPPIQLAETLAINYYKLRVCYAR